MEIWMRSSALAFHTLLAIVPVFGLLSWSLNSFGVTEQSLALLKQFVLSHLNVLAIEDFQSLFDRFSAIIANRKWGMMGGFILIYAAWGMVSKFGASLDFILKVKSADQIDFTLNFLRLTLRRAIAMLGLPVVVLLSIGVATWIREESWIKQIFSIETAGPFFALPLAWSVNIFALWLLYYFVPKRKVKSKSDIGTQDSRTIE